MQFSRVTLTGYKNYESRSFDFTNRVVGICGLNGRGKTNLLDAINYLCFTKSYFTRTDALNVKFGAEGFRLEGLLTNGQNELKKIHCIYRPSAKKEFFLDDVAYEKFSHHIGRFPCVVIAPDDVELITGGSEERRRFLDTILSQMDGEYLRQLILYNGVLQQRNSFLKNTVNGQYDQHLLEVFDQQLIASGNYLFGVRATFCEKLFPVIMDFYRDISLNREQVHIQYHSPLLQNDFKTLLREARRKDLMLQRTTTGVHRDDLVFTLQGHPFKNIGSQGQRKSLLFSCKLAEYTILAGEKGFAPLLLLDDVFEKLDESRMRNLLAYVCTRNEGQVFITHTDGERLKSTLGEFTSDIQIIDLD